MLFLYGIVAIVVLIHFYFKLKYSFWEKRGFLSVPGKIPLGSISGMGRTVHSSQFMKKVYDDHKGKAPAVGLYFLTAPILVPLEPELVKDILVRNFDSFHDRGFYCNEKDDPLAAQLFFLSGAKWKSLRAKLTPTFTSGKMKMMFGNVSSVCDRVIDFVKPSADISEGIEVKEILSSLTTEIISNVAFGLDTKCLGNSKNEFRTMANRVFNPPHWESIKFMFMNQFDTISKFFGLKLNRDETISFFTDVINNSFKHRELNSSQRNDFFQLLLQIKKNDPDFTMNDVAANSFVFFLAGFETSSSVATFALYELAMNQDIQDQLRREIEESLEKSDGEITYESLLEMKYLDRCFNETLRKYPVVDVQFRKASKDFKIPNSDLVIPKGVAIMISSNGLHQDERFFENPEKFDPDRFTEENVKARHPFAYIPFSEGPRICIGARFGTMQTKIALVKLLSKYRFLPYEKTPNPIRFVPHSAFQVAEGGMWLKIEHLN